jgi:uncharacterized protein YqgC (DUF456 family)
MEWLWILAIALILLGLVGVVIPGLPGTPVIFIGMLLGAWIDHFHRVGPFTLVLLAVMALAAWIVDFIASLTATKLAGASRWAMAGAILGGLVGLFFGPPGLILGPMIGAALGELISRRGLKQVARSSFAAGLGFVIALAFRIGMAVGMVAVFLFAYFL